MYSGAEIRRMQQEATRAAARERREPVVLYSEVDALDDWRSAPFLGEYRPAGWIPVTVDQLVNVPGVGARLWRVDGEDRALFFCDASGWGSDDELALSGQQQAELARALHGWAASNHETVGVGVVEAGQFQVVLAVWRQSRDYWALRQRHEDRLARRRLLARDRRYNQKGA